MTNHPNRSKHRERATPSPVDIRDSRIAANLTQAQAARVIYATERAWQDWEAGRRPMHPAFWELWRIKIDAK